MSLRLLSYLCLLLIVLCGCEVEDDDNFDVLRTQPEPEDPVLVEISTPFFQLETPNGEIFTTTGSGLLVANENGAIVSSESIVCVGDQTWNYEFPNPEIALTIDAVIGNNATGTYNGFATLETTDDFGNPITGYSRGFQYFDCETTMGVFELTYRSDSTLAGNFEAEIIALTDTTANAPCNGYTSLGFYKASFFTYLIDCVE